MTLSPSAGAAMVPVDQRLLPALLNTAMPNDTARSAATVMTQVSPSRSS